MILNNITINNKNIDNHLIIQMILPYNSKKMKSPFFVIFYDNNNNTSYNTNKMSFTIIVVFLILSIVILYLIFS